MDSDITYVIVEACRVTTVLLGALTISRLLAASHRADRLHRTKLRRDVMRAVIWLTMGLFCSAGFAILTHARPGPGWIFYPVSWVGYLLVMRLINDVEEADRG